MNILFCGDKKVEDGLLIAVASLLKTTREALHITVLTMELTTEQRTFLPVSSRIVKYLNTYVKRRNPGSSVTLKDMTELFLQDQPEANMKTRFTPYCMLRLYVDQIEEMPDRILYLDTDVVCRRSFKDFYYQDMEGYELAGVLDHYGKWFFRQKLFRMDYMNSGVLLMNMERIKETDLFENCRGMCRTKKMFMPDQSAINKLAKGKKFCDRRYNEQKKLRQDTVIQHFTTRFRYFPQFRVVDVKPWQIERMHWELKLFEYDELLEEYKKMKVEAER